jgi:hypothetical protein
MSGKDSVTGSGMTTPSRSWLAVSWWIVFSAWAYFASALVAKDSGVGVRWAWSPLFQVASVIALWGGILWLALSIITMRNSQGVTAWERVRQLALLVIVGVYFLVAAIYG